VTTHDPEDTRWLSVVHHHQVTSGRLRLPPPKNVHPSVLVSVPDHSEGTEVSWIDRDLAELVLLCHRRGFETIESCQDDCGKATLYFANRRTRDRFLDYLCDNDLHDWEAPGYQASPWSPRVWAARLTAGAGVWFPPGDVALVVRRLDSVGDWR
jgi:hypothetical protein